MSLYLKYRPLDFNNLVGQDFIKETLQNAIKQNKTVGAYLFCGPRGTGKTSTARIFAKAINCKSEKDGNPCLKCDLCLDFLENRIIDIIEIDAASYTGVDNIRNVIDKAQFSPTKTKFKVYIIDEVHMLSNGAFNALLKILEEPPIHVKFILATTEINKVPDTILSRCQRYDFKNISNENIKKRLAFISKEEKVKIDEKSLDYIVSVSNGGLRNAINIYEQLVVNNVINYDNILSSLGITDKKVIESFFDKLLNKDKSIISDFDTLVTDGKNIKLFFKDLIFYIKDETLLNLVSGKDVKINIYILDILNKSYSKTKDSVDENTILLISLIKIISGYTESFDNISNSNENNIKTTKTKALDNKSDGQTSKDKSVFLEEKKKDTSIGTNEAIDIFKIEEENEEKPIMIKKDEKKETSDGFNKENYISQIKEVGGKASLTMSLRGASFSLNDLKLIIRFPTKFAFKSVNTNESILLLNEALIKNGNPDIKIILESN